MRRIIVSLVSASLVCCLTCSAGWAQATARDLLVLGGCLLWEHSSLMAFWRVAKELRRARRHRREIMSRRRVSDENIAQWFAAEPRTRSVARTAFSGVETR